MSNERAELKALLQDLANEEHRREPAHLTADEFLNYLSGDKPPEEYARIQDHLVMCRQCTVLLLAIGGFAELTQPTDTSVSDSEIAAAWERMKAIIGTDRGGRPLHATGRRRFRDTVAPAHGWAMAASFLVALVALGTFTLTLYRENRRLSNVAAESPVPAAAGSDIAGYARQVAELRQQVEALSQPQANVLIVDLYPADATRSSSSDVTTMNVPAGANLITVILNTAAEYEYRDYSVEILDQSSTRIWQGERLRKTAFGNFTLMVPRRFLPAGHYQIQLRGVRGGRATVIEQYVVRIRYL